LEFIVTCGQCGETANFKDGDRKNMGEIDIITYEDSEVEIWCDKCNDHITL
jgi:hypothetical protein